MGEPLSPTSRRLPTARGLLVSSRVRVSWLGPRAEVAEGTRPRVSFSLQVVSSLCGVIVDVRPVLGWEGAPGRGGVCPEGSVCVGGASYTERPRGHILEPEMASVLRA